MTRHPAAVAEHHNDSAAIKKNPTYSAWRSGQFSTTKRLRLAKTADFRGFRASRIAQLRKLGLGARGAGRAIRRRARRPHALFDRLDAPALRHLDPRQRAPDPRAGARLAAAG